MGLFSSIGNLFTSGSNRRASNRAFNAQQRAIDQSIETIRAGDIKRRNALSGVRDAGNVNIGAGRDLQGRGFDQFDTGGQLSGIGFDQFDVAGDITQRGFDFQDRAAGQFGFAESQRGFGAGLQGQLPGLLEDIQRDASAGGFASNLESLRGTLDPLIQKRQQSAANDLARLGLGRSTDRARSIGDIELGTLAGFENQLSGRRAALPGQFTSAIGQAFGAAQNAVTGGTNIFSTGTGAINAGTGAGQLAGNLVQTGAGISQGGANIVSAGGRLVDAGTGRLLQGTPEENFLSVASLQGQKGGVEANRVLAERAAKNQGIGGLLGIADAGLSALTLGI